MKVSKGNVALATERKGWELDGVLDDLRRSREVTHNIRRGGHIRELPSPGVMVEVLESLCAALFPAHLGNATLTRQNTEFFVSTNLSTALTRLAEQVRKGLLFTEQEELSSAHVKARARDITQAFARSCRTFAQPSSATSMRPMKPIRPPAVSPKSCSATGDRRR